MKLKQRPEDFQVEELTDAKPGPDGGFAFYQLEKRSLGTPEGLQIICRRWKIPFQRISYGGLKDRHAVTTQYLTIWHGPRRGLKQTGLILNYVGQLARPYTSEQIQANRFTLMLRDLTPAARETAQQALNEAGQDGVPNYFDDQRFGSVGAGQQFVARAMIDADYETALKLTLAEPYEFDRAAQKEEKRLLREHWGQWSAAKEKLPRGHARSIVTYLVDHPADFRGAIVRLRTDLKSLYLSAYQSHLWNRMLSRWLEQHCRPEQLVSVQLRLGKVVLCRRLDPNQRQLCHTQRLPLPSARLKLAEDDPLKPLVEAVLREDNLELCRMKLKHFREPFFFKGERPAFFVPQNLTHRVEPDELNTGQEKLVLSFDLPRGCYATMLVKRITLDV